MHIRCPHCHNAIEIVEDSSFRDVECLSCGSHFNLVGSDAPTESGPSKPRKLAHFDLIEQLGVGHFGAVWKAKDTTLDRFVAVKIPRKEQLDESDTENFFREARAAAQLRHPNIVGVHEVGREGDTIFIASDYVEGSTLKEWLKRQPIPHLDAARLCGTIADALHAAHETGVIHRDLKPSNVMMDMNCQPHIMDFGLAKRESGEITITIEGVPLGTPAYMPPEQAAGKGHDADRRSDVYSLGVILFEMLTAELPFRGDKRVLIVQIQQEEPPSPRQFNRSVPQDLETICLKCLEKSPDRRYNTAMELSEDFNRFIRNEPIRARPASSLRRTLRWLISNWAKLRATGIVVIMAIAATLLLQLTMLRYTNSEMERDMRRGSDQLGTVISHIVDDVWELGGQMRAVRMLQEIDQLSDKTHVGIVYFDVAPGHANAPTNPNIEFSRLRSVDSKQYRDSMGREYICTYAKLTSEIRPAAIEILEPIEYENRNTAYFIVHLTILWGIQAGLIVAITISVMIVFFRRRMQT